MTFMTYKNLLKWRIDCSCYHVNGSNFGSHDHPMIINMKTETEATHDIMLKNWSMLTQFFTPFLILNADPIHNWNGT